MRGKRQRARNFDSGHVNGVINWSATNIMFCLLRASWTVFQRPPLPFMGFPFESLIKILRLLWRCTFNVPLCLYTSSNKYEKILATLCTRVSDIVPLALELFKNFYTYDHDVSSELSSSSFRHEFHTICRCLSLDRFFFVHLFLTWSLRIDISPPG